MRYAPRAALAGVLGFATSFVVACGGGAGLLSTDQSSTLNDQLNQVSSAVQAHNCPAAGSAVGTLSNDVLGLPPSVNTTLRSDLTQGVATVSQLASRDCNQTTTTQTTTTTSSTTTTTQTSTTQTSTTNTTTSPSSTTTSATTTTGTGTSSTGGAGLGAGAGAAGLGTGTSNGGNSN